MLIIFPFISFLLVVVVDFSVRLVFDLNGMAQSGFRLINQRPRLSSLSLGIFIQLLTG
jgi:hypothetical protein